MSDKKTEGEMKMILAVLVVRQSSAWLKKIKMLPVIKIKAGTK
jgi:hypothetical protein